MIALIGGGLLASFSLRTESALTEPGLDRDEHEFGRGEERVPGAEAETEQLPTQRPDLHDDPSPPGADPPQLGPGEAALLPDSAPPDAGPASPDPPERD